ncbi:hypothetical protein Fmac_006180 [Flemingia macrophylla]|uniref:Uncharacterized protein n=1 Tax=Flemingia macrophylla TaxID=520843 RepID=A0ABD1N9Z2_9FABA
MRTWKVDWSRKAQRATKSVAGEGAKLPAKSRMPSLVSRDTRLGCETSPPPNLLQQTLLHDSLVAADMGMEIGVGTDIAIEAADIVLMKSNLKDVITAIDLSRKTFSRILLNYFWALGYNLLGIPIAAGALFPSTRFRFPPWIAGAAMAASSVSVDTQLGLRDSCGPPWVSQAQLRVLREVDAQRGLRDLAGSFSPSPATLLVARCALRDQSTFHVRIPHSTSSVDCHVYNGCPCLTCDTGTYP